MQATYAIVTRFECNETCISIAMVEVEHIDFIMYYQRDLLKKKIKYGLNHYRIPIVYQVIMGLFIASQFAAWS